jgi:hypothetical protein
MNLQLRTARLDDARLLWAELVTKRSKPLPTSTTSGLMTLQSQSPS